MPKPQPDDKVHVIVNERPNKVWVVCNDEIHFAYWRTSDTGDSLRKIEGNAGLLHAAMLAWDGQDKFTLTFKEIEAHAHGFGAWQDGTTYLKGKRILPPE